MTDSTNAEGRRSGPQADDQPDRDRTCLIVQDGVDAVADQVVGDFLVENGIEERRGLAADGIHRVGPKNHLVRIPERPKRASRNGAVDIAYQKAACEPIGERRVGPGFGHRSDLITRHGLRAPADQ